MQNQFSEQEWRNALIILAQFVISGNRDNIRSDLHKNAIEIAVFLGTKDNKIITLSDIRKILLEDLWGIRLPSNIISETLKILESESRIIIELENIFLTEKRKKEMLGTQQKYISNKNHIEKDVLEKARIEYQKTYRKKLEPDQEYQILTNFWLSLSNYTLQKANIISEIITGKIQIQESLLASDVIRQSLLNIEEVNLRLTLRKIIVNLFESPSDYFIEFMSNAHQNLICWKILNLDPSCQRVAQVAFSNKLILLDTNVLLAIVCERGWKHQLVIEIINLTKELGTKIMITDRTITEYMKVLNASNERFSKLKVPLRILKRIKDVFIQSFAYEHEESPTTTWDEYYKKMCDPFTVLKQFNVELFKSVDIQVQELPYYNDIINKISECYNDFYNQGKKDDVAEHDAYHLLTVKILRERSNGSELLGPNYWFLTLDRTLNCSNSFINRKGEFQNLVPSSIYNDLWLEMITPFLNTSLREHEAPKVFAEMLRSQFASIPQGISPRILIAIQGEWVKYQWLEADEVLNIIQKQFIGKMVSKIESEEVPEKDKQQFIEEVKSYFDTELSKIFNEKMGTFNQTLTNNAEQIENLETKINDLQSYKDTEEKFKRIWRSISGILGGFLIIISVYIILTNETPSVQTTFLSSVIIIAGIIFILIAIAYEQVKAQLSVGTSLNMDVKN